MYYLILMLLLGGCVWVDETDENSDGERVNSAPVIVVDGTRSHPNVGVDTYVIDLTASYDREEDDFEIVTVVTDPNGRETVTESKQLNILPDVAGTYEIEINAIDEHGETSSQSVSFDALNSAPIPHVRGCAADFRYLFFDVDSLILRGPIESLCLDFSESVDREGHPIAIYWSFDNPSESGTVDGDGIMRFRFSSDGVYEGSVTLDDRFGGVHRMDIQIVVE